MNIRLKLTEKGAYHSHHTRAKSVAKRQQASQISYETLYHFYFPKLMSYIKQSLDTIYGYSQRAGRKPGSDEV